MIELRADKARLVVLRREYVTSGSHRVYDVQFRFSRDWDGLTKLALFRVGQNEPTAPILLPMTDRCQIPTEILYESGKMLYIGVMGVASDAAIPEDITELISPLNDEGEVPDTEPSLPSEEEKPDPIVLPTMWCQYDMIRKGVQSEQIGIGEAITEMGQIRDETVVASNAAQANAERAEEAADRAEDAVLHPPIIDDETENWLLWDFNIGEYVNSGSTSRGEQGIQGPIGETGQNGSDGLSAYEIAVANGFTGAETEWLESLKQGPVGPKGDKGDKGDPGQDGKDGETGPQGAIGPRGPQGVKGDKGDQGPPGKDGADGAKGETGAVGPPGPQGATGATGATGPKGDQGDVGPAGQKGEKGDKGDPGVQGPQGVKGDQGETGPKGDTGERGPQGDKGDPGENGQGVPEGGTTGQFLGKLSNDSYDTGWFDPPSGGVASPASLVAAPKGAIMAWTDPDNIPDGWHICDGEDGTFDLRGQFLLGASDDHVVGETGGEEEHTLTVSEMPKHQHVERLSDGSHVEPYTYTGSGGFTGTRISANYSTKYASNWVTTDYEGSGKPHNNMPPYTVIVWIQKMVDDPEPVTTFSVKVPVGCVVYWSGSEDNIPQGWALCDGEDGRPDYRDQFILAAGPNHPVHTTGGEEDHTLIVDEIPSHAHIEYIGVEGETYAITRISSGTPSTKTFTSSSVTDGNLSITAIKTGNEGGGSPHNNMPPYYALCAIVKIAPDETDIPDVDLSNYVTKEEFESLSNTIGDISVALDAILKGGSSGLINFSEVKVDMGGIMKRQSVPKGVLV